MKKENRETSNEAMECLLNKAGKSESLQKERTDRQSSQCIEGQQQYLDIFPGEQKESERSLEKKQKQTTTRKRNATKTGRRKKKTHSSARLTG
jgi:hypothetical protein